MLEIIIQFKLLIIKRANKLNYDGTDTDLIIHLIEKIYAMDVSLLEIRSEGELINYIVRIIKTKESIYFETEART